MPKKLTPKGQAAPPVEPNIAQASIPRKPAPKRRAAPKVAESDAMYVRNLHNIRSRVTLESGRELQLAPRGQREDLDIVSSTERDDPKFLLNLGVIFELVEPEVAREIISKQQYNSSQQEHPIWGQLRNEQGKPYDQRTIHVDPAFERQGQVVGHIEETGSGRFTDKNHQISRTAGPIFVDAPGSPGHPATEKMLPQDVPADITMEEYREFLQWKKFKEAMDADESSES